MPNLFSTVSKFLGFAERTLPALAKSAKVEEFVYHATDVSRATKIREQGLRAGSWFAKSPEEALRSGVTPISGNIRDLRIFAVPKKDIQKVAADAADMGARLIEKGKYMMSGVAHAPVAEVPIEEALQSFYRGSFQDKTIRSGTITKEVMKLGQGSNNTTQLRRSIRNPAKGSRKMTDAL